MRMVIKHYFVIFVIFSALLLVFTSCHDEEIKEPEPENIAITVALDAAGGELTGETEYTFYPGEPPKVPSPKREGYIFVGWDKDISLLDSNTTIVAQWEEKTFKVSFDLNGGDTDTPELLSQTVRYGEDAVLPEVYREDYVFSSWSNECLAVTCDITATANWTLKELDQNEIYDKCIGACVELQTYDKSDIELSLGSGFLISPDGVVVTAAHVISGAANVKVTLWDGRKYFAESVLGYDFDKDIALIKIAGEDLPYLELSNDELVEGGTVYAIGSPGGRTGEITKGNVMRFSFVYGNTGLIVSSARIESGSSGGPLIDSQGRVIGINVAMSSITDEFLAVRVAELESLNELDYSMADYFAVAGTEGFQRPETEINDTESLAQSVEHACVIRGVLSDKDDTDVYKCEGVYNVMFMLSVESKYSDDVVIRVYSKDRAERTKERYYHGISGNYIIFCRTVITCFEDDAYIEISAENGDGSPISYSLRPIVYE